MAKVGHKIIQTSHSIDFSGEHDEVLREVNQELRKAGLIPEGRDIYIAFENNILLDYNDDIVEIFDELSAKMKAEKSFNTFAYLRQNVSSHLRQRDLSSVSRFGIDMRFLADGNAVPILPNQGRHLHVGFFRFNDEKKGFTFFKEEAHGFGSASDKIAHAKNYFVHLLTGKSKQGPRETATPIEFIEKMIGELEQLAIRMKPYSSN